MFKLCLFIAFFAIVSAAPAPEADPVADPIAAPEPAPEASPEANPDWLITHTVPVVSQSLIYKSPIVPIARPYSAYNVLTPYVYYPNYYI